MPTLPTLFISHGAPTLAIEDGPARRFLQAWPQQQERPRAILVFSAHWQRRDSVGVSTAAQPRTLHDFGGFPHALYELQYPAPGAPALAEQTLRLLRGAGFAAEADAQRGLDHGAWVPLSLMYPQADIPVFQVSLLQDAGPAQHVRLGAALLSLRTQGVLILGSGALTHNLREIGGHHTQDTAPDWVSAFAEWMANALQQGDVQALLNYRQLAPHAARNHPTPEHLLPLFAAWGAAGEHAGATRLHSSHTYGILAMDAYAFSA